MTKAPTHFPTLDDVVSGDGLRPGELAIVGADGIRPGELAIVGAAPPRGHCVPLFELTLKELDAIRDALSVAQEKRAMIVDPEDAKPPTREEIISMTMGSPLFVDSYLPTTKNLAERHHLAPVAVVMLKTRKPQP